MDNFQIDRLMVKLEAPVTVPPTYKLEVEANTKGTGGLETLTPTQDNDNKELVFLIEDAIDTNSKVLVLCNKSIGNSLDFSSYTGNRDYILLLNSDTRVSPANNTPSAYLSVGDTNYPPPYKPRLTGVDNPAYNHKIFSTKFTIEKAEFIRDLTNPHLFKVSFEIGYDTSLYNYKVNRIALEWDMARPELDAIVIHVDKVAAGGGGTSPLKFPDSGYFYVQLDNYTYKGEGLPVIITEDNVLNENHWADFDSKKMIIYIDSLFPIIP